MTVVAVTPPGNWRRFCQPTSARVVATTRALTVLIVRDGSRVWRSVTCGAIIEAAIKAQAVQARTLATLAGH